METKEGQQKEEEDENKDDDDKKENRDEVSTSYDSIYSIAVDQTFYEGLK